jgi:hypothetical protein
MNKATLLHNLEVIARTRFAEGKRILLVVDEAQNLPAASLEELRMLANFQVEGRSLFQSFLLGQEELRRTLQGANMEQVRQRIIAAYHLEPLSAEETRSYIEFRLGCVDWEGDPKLDDQVYRAVFAQTQGVPRRINSLCDRLFLFGCLESRHQFTAEDVNIVVDEIRQQVGQADAAGASTGAWQGAIAAADGEPALALSGDIGERLAALEAEVARLRAMVQKERKLLRKAVLLQLELDAYDDVD